MKRENVFDRIDDRLIVGRRLLAGELPEVDIVIDLTCELNERSAVRGPRYLSLPILDANVPEPGQLDQWIEQIAEETGTLYVHCAEGHGRTGLFAAALLLRRGQAKSAEQALEILQASRPGVRLNRKQRIALVKYATRC